MNCLVPAKNVPNNTQQLSKTDSQTHGERGVLNLPFMKFLEVLDGSGLLASLWFKNCECTGRKLKSANVRVYRILEFLRKPNGETKLFLFTMLFSNRPNKLYILSKNDEKTKDS